MQKTTSERGNEVYKGATHESVFSADLFHEVDMSWQTEDCGERDIQYALHTDIGSLTVLDRMTGFGYRDIETGYRDARGEFWLASGGFDVRHSNSKTMGEAIEWVKRNANNCIGKESAD